MKSIRYLILFSVTFFTNCNSNKNTDTYTVEEILTYSKRIGIPTSKIFFIKDEIQKDIFDKGQPFLTVYDKNFKGLKIGTCYEELPFLIDTLLIQKKLVTDTMSFYENEILIQKKIKQLKFQSHNKAAIDSSKKYFIFYHYAMYAEKLDKIKILPMYERYKDSVQFFFVNVDKIKDLQFEEKL